MTHVIKQIGSTEQEMTLTLEPSEYQPKLDENYKLAQANVQVKGFRKGKVPMHMVKRLVGKEIESETVETLASEMFSKVAAEQKLKLVGRARIRHFEFTDDKLLNIYLMYEVQPEFDLAPYKDYTFKKAEYQITPEDIEREVKNILREQGVWMSKDGEATEDDLVVADSQELDANGMPIIGRRFENQEIVLRMIRKESPLRAALTGVKAGDERIVELKSNDANQPNVSKQYKFYIKEVKQLDLPELTDDLAKELTQGHLQTAAEFRADIESRLKATFKRKAEEDLLEEIAKKFIEDNPIEVPQTMIRSFEDMIIENAARQLGGKFPKGFDIQAFRREISQNAKRQAQWALIRHKLAEVIGIKIDEQSIRDIAEADAKEMGIDNPDQVLQAYLKEDMQNYIIERAMREKLFAYLTSTLKITPEPKRISDTMMSEEVVN
ncbi:MAG: trigger factor [Chloroherpetonaceae bacterium]